VSGQYYEFEDGKTPGDIPIAPLPTWLLAVLEEAYTQKVSTWVGDGSREGQPIPEGERNEALFKLGCSLRGQGRSEEEIVATLVATNDQRCIPPLPPEEVQRIARSTTRYPAGPRAPGEPYTDLGNAKRFISHHGQDLRYVPLWGKWVAWDG